MADRCRTAQPNAGARFERRGDPREL